MCHSDSYLLYKTLGAMSNVLFNGLRHIISRLHRRPDEEDVHGGNASGASAEGKKKRKKRPSDTTMDRSYSMDDGGGSTSSKKSRTMESCHKNIVTQTTRSLKTPQHNALGGLTPSQVATTPWRCVVCGHQNKPPGKVRGIKCFECGASRKFKRRKLNSTPKYSGIVSVNEVTVDLSWSWQKIWATLKSEGGWTWAKNNGLNSSYTYLMPGIKKSTGTLGVNMFGSYSEVMKHLKSLESSVLGEFRDGDEYASSSEDDEEEVEPPVSPPDTMTIENQDASVANVAEGVSKDESDYDLIDLKEPWANIYYLLKQSGWKHCNAPSSDLQNTHYFLAPNAPKSKRDCIVGQHIFHNSEAVIKYIRKMKNSQSIIKPESDKKVKVKGGKAFPKTKVTMI